jgi:hypothetical protein
MNVVGLIEIDHERSENTRRVDFLPARPDLHPRGTRGVSSLFTTSTKFKIILKMLRFRALPPSVTTKFESNQTSQ